jgi:hypothetical protein
VRFGDLLIRQRRQLLAARAHLNGNFAERPAAKMQARSLVVIRAPDITELVQRPLLEFLDRFDRGRLRHKSILARCCFKRTSLSAGRANFRVKRAADRQSLNPDREGGVRLFSNH